MAEFTNANTVTVAAGQNLPLTETPISGTPCIVFLPSDILLLLGMTRREATKINLFVTVTECL